MELKNKTILITGGTSGLGYQFASKLHALGNTVIITGRDRAKLDATVAKLPGIHAFQSDVSDPNAIEALAEEISSRFPGLDILINNAGEMRTIKLRDSAPDLPDITREIDVNLIGPIRMIQQFLPLLTKSRSAAILNVTSGLALIPFPLSPIYGAAKSGLRSYTKSLRTQLKGTNIQVVELIAPAAKTPLNDKFENIDGFDTKMLLAPEKIIDAAIKALKNNKKEVYPGVARIFLIMSRLAPALMLKQTSKIGVRFLQGA
jgi:uncharacterized oxidoreductase